MKKMLLLAAVLFGAIATMHAQEKPRKRPVTEKPRQETPSIKAEPTPEGQASRERAAEEIRKSRAEKRAKMEETKRSVKDRIASDTTATKR